MKALFLLMTLSTIGFSGATFAQDQEADQRAIEVVEKTVKALASEDLNCRVDSDCAVIAYGARACGGPAGYLVASKLNPVFTEIKYLAKRTVEREEKFNADYGVISICSLAVRPTSTCAQSNKCSN